MKKNKNSTLYYMLSPAFLLMSFIIFFPIGFTFYASLTNWRGLGFDMKFVGLYNYVDMFQDPRFLTAMENNIIWMVLFLIIPMTGGFLLALLLNTGLKGQTIFKVIFYLPGVISYVVIGIIFSLIFSSTSHGMVNEVLKLLHLDIFIRPWLSSRLLALPVIILASSWQYLGFCMVLFLAGMQALPGEVLEASEIDGAKFYQKVFHIIIPLLKPVSVVVLLITLINSIKVFDLVYVLTYGGPMQQTETIGFVMYDLAFRSNLLGKGSAYGVFIFLLTTIPSIIYVRHMLKTEIEY